VKPFLTGSHAYGVPKEGSDLDIVVLLDNCLASTLLSLSMGSVNIQYGSVASASLRFGPLNIIAITDEAEFTAWKTATDLLIAMKPVTREQAVACIKKHVAEAKASK